MFLRVDNRIWMLLLIALMISVQIRFPTWETTVFPPILIGAAALFLFRQQIVAYDFNAVKKSSLWKEVYHALIIALILQAVGITLVRYGFGLEPPDSDYALSLATPLVVVMFSSPIEELIFRKIIFGSMKPKLGFWPSAAVSSILFAAVHHNYAAFLGNVAIGVVFCRAYHKSGNLFVTISAHMLFNFLVFIAMSLR